MHPIDWAIIAVYLVWMVWDGLRLTTRSHELEGFLLGGRQIPWWAVGLSVMATQLSAITMIGTTGQGYADGMRFLQFYYALPIAMIVLSVTLVPFFHNAKVYTAYEYLERRFDAKTRAFTSLLFLLSRSMALGVVISAPAVVLSVVLGISVTNTVLLTALPTIVYTMFGGVQAVEVDHGTALPLVTDRGEEVRPAELARHVHRGFRPRAVRHDLVDRVVLDRPFVDLEEAETRVGVRRTYECDERRAGSVNRDIITERREGRLEVYHPAQTLRKVDCVSNTGTGVRLRHGVA